MAQQSLMLISGGSHTRLAEDLSRELELAVAPTEVDAFADGETRVRINADIRGTTVVIVQPTGPPVNDNLMTLGLLADAATAGGAATIVAVVPFFGYARQEVRGQSGDARSAQLAAKLLGVAGIDHLITLDLHAPALESALPMPATLLRPDELFLPSIKKWNIPDAVVVSPDAGGLKRAQRFASGLGAPLAVVTKWRPGPDKADAVQVLGDVRDRDCIIVDDMASTGRTLVGAAEAIRRAGAKTVCAVFTHAVMASDAVERIQGGSFGHVVTSDSIAWPAPSWIEVVSSAPLFARAIEQTCGPVRKVAEH